MILPIFALLIAGAAAAEAQTTGAIGVVDGLTLATPAATTASVWGWAFHPGGAAVLRYRVAIDCVPNSASSCPPVTAAVTYPRPDVTAAYPYWPVPDNSGWTITVAWSGVPAGAHWIYGAVADAAGGRDAWRALVPACVVKTIDSVGLSSVAPCDSALNRRVR